MARLAVGDIELTEEYYFVSEIKIKTFPKCLSLGFKLKLESRISRRHLLTREILSCPSPMDNSEDGMESYNRHSPLSLNKKAAIHKILFLKGKSFLKSSKNAFSLLGLRMLAPKEHLPTKKVQKNYQLA